MESVQLRNRSEEEFICRWMAKATPGSSWTFGNPWAAAAWSGSEGALLANGAFSRRATVDDIYAQRVWGWFVDDGGPVLPGWELTVRGTLARDASVEVRVYRHREARTIDMYVGVNLRTRATFYHLT